MRKSRSKVDKVSIAEATAKAQRIAKDRAQKYEEFQSDSGHDERLKQHLCKACFYLCRERIGGAALTNRECGICSTDMLFGSTATDPICFSCAKENGLCNQCGGDIDMKNRRNPYPFMSNGNDNTIPDHKK